MTSMATQWSHSTPVVLPIAGDRNGQHMQQAGQCQHGVGYASIQGLCPAQVNVNGKFSQPSSCCTSGINIFNILESYPSRQVLMQMAVNSIQEFDGMNPEATIP